MRITIVMPSLDLSGGGRIIAGHAERLAEKGHEVLIVAACRERFDLKQLVKRLIAREFRPRRVNSHTRSANLPHRTSKHFGRVVEDDVPDADLIIATWWETAEWINKFSSRKGVKAHFIQGYEAFSNIPTDRVDAVWRLPLLKITIAQWLVDLGRDRFGIEDMALVPNSIDDQFRTSQVRRKNNRHTVGFLFHNAAIKDLSTTLATIGRLRKLRPNVRFVSFGSEKPQSGQLPADVEFHHAPTQETIVDIYSRCDAWVSTSLTEGFNLPPLEAMGCGTPAVCSKTGRPLEIIEDGVNGFLIDQGDATGFAEALTAILSLPEQDWQRMSDAARRSVAHPSRDESSALFEKALVRYASPD